MLCHLSLHDFATLLTLGKASGRYVSPVVRFWDYLWRFCSLRGPHGQRLPWYDESSLSSVLSKAALGSVYYSLEVNTCILGKKTPFLAVAWGCTVRATIVRLGRDRTINGISVGIRHFHNLSSRRQRSRSTSSTSSRCYCEPEARWRRIFPCTCTEFVSLFPPDIRERRDL